MDAKRVSNSVLEASLMFRISAGTRCRVSDGTGFRVGVETRIRVRLRVRAGTKFSSGLGLGSN